MGLAKKCLPTHNFKIFSSTWGRILSCILFGFTLVTCEPAGQTTTGNEIGFSGLTKIGENSYLVVHDWLSHHEGKRLGVISVVRSDASSTDNYQFKYHEIFSSSWEEKEKWSSDLESICSLPGRENEFLLGESGDWEGKYGRIFHIRIEDGGKSVNVLKEYKLLIKANRKMIEDKVQEGDEYEGMTCLNVNHSLTIVLGERGDSKVNPTGTLRWGILDFNKPTIEWDLTNEIKVNAPGWNSDEKHRDIAGLYTDAGGTVWAVATQENDTTPKYKSIIYKLGTVQPNNPNQPINVDRSLVLEVVDKKVEGLSAPPDIIPEAILSFVTEEEEQDGSFCYMYQQNGSYKYKCSVVEK